MTELTFREPDNWHGHLRQGSLLEAVCHEFDIYGRVLCMGNTKPLIETSAQALDYRKRILGLNVDFEPVMCIMLTQDTTPEVIREAAHAGIKFVKFIPIGTSTGAKKGIRLKDIGMMAATINAIIETGMFLLVHAELMTGVNGKYVREFKREREAIHYLRVYRKRFSGLKITVEHASTADMINYILGENSPDLAATLTPQHAILTWYDVYYASGEMKNPRNYCYPVAKSEKDRQAVVRAMTSGDERFFAGTDAAPHWTSNKLLIPGSPSLPTPGVFFGWMEYLKYLEIFDQAGVLDRFEDFTSRFGAERYGFALNQEIVTVRKEEWCPPIIRDGVARCMEGENLGWKIVRK